MNTWETFQDVMVPFKQQLQLLFDSHLFSVTCAVDQYPSREDPSLHLGRLSAGKLMLACYSRVDRDEESHVSSRNLRDSGLNKDASHKSGILQLAVTGVFRTRFLLDGVS